VGLLLLSIVTSLPELAVSVFAVTCGDVGISIGTLFGSNIAKLGIVLGLTAILVPGTFVVTQFDVVARVELVDLSLLDETVTMERRLPGVTTTSTLVSSGIQTGMNSA
jgi:Ca2+/Na+ antiporter